MLAKLQKSAYRLLMKISAGWGCGNSVVLDISAGWGCGNSVAPDISADWIWKFCCSGYICRLGYGNFVAYKKF
ncbi:hypothetical protein [uncultured Eubacterium sp.]|uniref:hypothetical protein n=1 Tax=uncultured Eubacterium sp. TaxID=165185 RepID=UPI0026DBC960|nr:hypothetical protein [uncultured Eubacterium sp.]